MYQINKSQSTREFIQLPAKTIFKKKIKGSEKYEMCSEEYLHNEGNGIQEKVDEVEEVEEEEDDNFLS